MNKITRTLAVAVPLLGLTLASPASANNVFSGSDREREVFADLHPVAGTDLKAHGKAEVEYSPRGVVDEFEIKAKGLLADHPHAAHIHFGEQARHECPTLADDTNGDRELSTAEGLPAYGGIALSLTTSGDTSPASALAIDRFSTAPKGMIDFEREEDFATAPGVAEAIAMGKGVVVIHGLDRNGDGTYSGDRMSELDPSLPAEATDPALCGVLEHR